MRASPGSLEVPPSRPLRGLRTKRSLRHRHRPPIQNQNQPGKGPRVPRRRANTPAPAPRGGRAVHRDGSTRVPGSGQWDGRKGRGGVGSVAALSPARAPTRGAAALPDCPAARLPPSSNAPAVAGAGEETERGSCERRSPWGRFQPDKVFDNKIPEIADGSKAQYFSLSTNLPQSLQLPCSLPTAARRKQLAHLFPSALLMPGETRLSRRRAQMRGSPEPPALPLASLTEHRGCRAIGLLAEGWRARRLLPPLI